MAASVQFRPQNRDLGMVMREVDEDLAIFLGIRNVEIDKDDHLLAEESHHFDYDDDDDDDDNLKCEKPQPDSLLGTCLAGADDNFRSLEMETSDHDWLLKHPDSSLLPSFDAEAQDSAAMQTKLSNGEDNDILLKSEVDVITSCISERSSPLEKSASVESKRPSSSKEGKPIRSRATTPTSRPSLSAKSRPSRNPTPTSRPTLLPSSKPIAPQPRSSTPVRPTLLPNSSKPLKSGSRSSTPTHKPGMDRSSSSGKKIGPTVLKSRPSQDADPKPKRAASASRGRLSSHSSSSSSSCSSSSSSNEKPRQKSCSPTRARAPISAGYKSRSRALSRSRGYGNGEDDDVNPVVMGTKMVDRVVNMRKLAPPKQDEYVCKENTRKSPHENSGFGRSLSKKSLEMAIRHMDIGPRVPSKSRASTATQTSNSESSKSSS